MAIKLCNNLRNWKNICLNRAAWTCSARYLTRYVRNIDPLPTKYGGKTNVTILPGSGIGPEIMECTLQVLKAAGAPLSYEILTLSSDENASDDFEYVLTSIRRNRVALKGNIEVRSKNPYVRSRNILLRKTLDLYAYILCCKTYPGLPNKFGEIDITVVRQNTEGEYLMLEHEPTPESVESLKIVTRYNSERVIELAFKYAVANNRKLITVLHNSDVQVLTESVFLDAAKTIAKKYPTIKMNLLEVGVGIVKIASNPRNFDIILTTNLNGSLVSNYLNGMLGTPGLSSGMNLSDTGIAIFEPGVRNKGSSIVGKGIANPVAMIKAGVDLLNYLGYHKTAETIQSSVFATLVYDKVRTHDLGGTVTTKEITDNIISHIKRYQRPKSEKKKDHLMHRWKTYCNVPDDQLPK